MRLPNFFYLDEKMKDYIDEERIERLSLATSNTLERRYFKLVEEVGELAQAYLGYVNCDSASASASNTSLDLIEECCDVINCAMDVMNKAVDEANISEDDVRYLFNRKLDKWDRKQKEIAEKKNEK